VKIFSTNFDAFMSEISLIVQATACSSVFYSDAAYQLVSGHVCDCGITTVLPCFLQSSVFFLGQGHEGQDSNPYDLVVDPFSRTLYWSDSSRNVIRAARLDTANVGVVVNSGQPRYLAVAPEQG
jgi:hypothetical protein